VHPSLAERCLTLPGDDPLDFKVIVDAVVNSGPREDSCRIGSAGVVRRQAIDVSPLRRVNTVPIPFTLCLLDLQNSIPLIHGMVITLLISGHPPAYHWCPRFCLP